MKHGAILSTADINGVAINLNITPDSTTPVINVNVTSGNYGKWTASQDHTINASGSQFFGQEVTFIIVNDSILPRIITFNTGFKVTATITGAILKTAIIRFVSDGTNFYELSRTLGL